MCASRNTACSWRSESSGWTNGWNSTTLAVNIITGLGIVLNELFTMCVSYIQTTGRLKYLTLTEASRVWMPDLFFSNEKEGHFHNIIMPNVYIRIYPYGSVLYSIRISLTLACPMNLKLYPLDRQTCSLRMASCKYIDTPHQIVREILTHPFVRIILLFCMLQFNI